MAWAARPPAFFCYFINILLWVEYSTIPISVPVLPVHHPSKIIHTQLRSFPGKSTSAPAHRHWAVCSYLHVHLPYETCLVWADHNSVYLCSSSESSVTTCLGMMKKMNIGGSEQDRNGFAWSRLKVDTQTCINSSLYLFNLKCSLLYPSRSCWKHISGVFVFRPNLLDRLDNIKEYVVYMWLFT